MGFKLAVFAIAALVAAVLCNNSTDVTTVTPPKASNSEDAQSSLHSFLLRKAEDVRDVIVHGYAKSGLPVVDPLRLDPIRVLMQETEGFLNLTLRKATVSGLSAFSVHDVASNLDRGQASVLLAFPGNLTIEGSYRMKGFLNPPHSQRVADEGRFVAHVGRAGATWSTFLSPLNSDEVRVAQTDVTAFLDDVDHVFESRKLPTLAVRELRETAAAALMDKIQRKVEDALIKAFSVSLSKSSWISAGRGPPPVKNDVTLKRRKRQVPCNNGQELDEYVTTLLSFASRIVRIMEPIGFPNITAYIDNQLIVFLYNGRARGISTITSRKEPYVFCPNNTITLGMVVGFKELVIEANYRVMQDYQMLLFNGEAEIKISDPVSFIQLTQVTYEDDTKQTLDRLKLWSLGKVQVLLKGLGNLTKAVSMLLTNTINQDPGQFVGMLENQLADMARQQLANISVPLFSLI